VLPPTHPSSPVCAILYIYSLSLVLFFSFFLTVFLLSVSTQYIPGTIQYTYIYRTILILGLRSVGVISIATRGGNYYVTVMTLSILLALLRTGRSLPFL
jgi:hypothetical protein